MTDDGFERFVDYVEQNLGHSTTYYERKHLRRRFNARMRRLGYDEDDFQGYLQELEDDEQERDNLLDAMSINVTGFFRNPEVWGALRDVLDVLGDDPGTLRAWSVPCSDGREPYSLAMMTIDEGLEPHGVAIRGSDIDERALDVARRGVYRSTHASDVDDEIREFDPSYRRYVEEIDDDAYRVREDVRSRVTFRPHDVIADTTPRDFDLVLCRNLLIYIEERYKPDLFDHLEDAVADGGYLVIGKTETIPASRRDRFTTVDHRNRIYRLDLDENV